MAFFLSTCGSSGFCLEDAFEYALAAEPLRSWFMELLCFLAVRPSPLYTFHGRVSFQVPFFLQKLFLFPFDVSYWGGAGRSFF